MKSFKSFYEDLTFKVEVEGLPAMWMSGNSPGQVKNHLRKLIKQPSMIKSVKRQTKHDVKKMYRKKAQGKEVEEMTQQSKTHPNLKIAIGKSAQSAKDTKARADKRRAQKSGTALAAGTQCEATSGEVDYGTDKSVKIMKKVTPNEGRMDRTISRHADAMKIHKAQFKKTGDAKHMNAFRDAKKRHDTAVQKQGHGKMEEGKGLWANIHAKRKRGERMRKKGEKGAPTPAAIKSAQKENAKKFAMADKKAYKDTNTNNAMDMVKANDAQSKKGYKTEKITLAKVRKALYKGAKALGDVQAVRKKRVGKRIVRRAAGKVAGRALGKLFR